MVHGMSRINTLCVATRHLQPQTKPRWKYRPWFGTGTNKTVG